MAGLRGMCTAGVLLCSLILTPGTTGAIGLNSHRMSYDAPRYGLYRISGKITRGFENFYEFELIVLADASRESVTIGKLAVDGAVFVRPSEFESAVQTESRGDLDANGVFRKSNVVRLRFKSAILLLQPAGSDQVEFETESVQGVHYKFKGTFIDGPLISGVYINLRGTLSKFEAGKRTAESEFNFVRWSYE